MICRKKNTTARCEAVQWEPLRWWPGYHVGSIIGSGAVIQTGPAVGMVLVLGAEARPVHPGEWIVRTESHELGEHAVFLAILPDEDFRASYDEIKDAA